MSKTEPNYIQQVSLLDENVLNMMIRNIESIRKKQMEKEFRSTRNDESLPYPRSKSSHDVLVSEVVRQMDRLIHHFNIKTNNSGLEEKEAKSLSESRKKLIGLYKEFLDYFILHATSFERGLNRKSNLSKITSEREMNDKDFFSFYVDVIEMLEDSSNWLKKNFRSLGKTGLKDVEGKYISVYMDKMAKEMKRALDQISLILI